MLGNHLDTIGETDSVMAFFRKNLIDFPTSIIVKSNLISDNYKLYQNFPNPFNPVTSIKFQVAGVDSRPDKSGYKETHLGGNDRVGGNGRVGLKVFDLLGREVRTLVNEMLQPGTYSVRFDVYDLPSGVYFYQLRAGDFSDTKKLILLK